MNRHWRNFQDKDYLGSHNLEEGEEMLVTIAKFVGEEEVESADGKKTKMVLYFKEEVPKMILNVTNGLTIGQLYGTHPEDWIGKQIQIFATPVKAFGKVQDALRIRDFAPKRDVDIVAFATQLDEAKTLEELASTWRSFPASARNDADLFAKKEGLKAKLA